MRDLYIEGLANHIGLESCIGVRKGEGEALTGGRTGQTALWLGRNGHDVRVVTPGDFPNLPCPTYPEIRVALFAHSKLVPRIAAFHPEALHIATEAPLGFAARLLQFSGSAVHKFLSHAISAVPAIAPADSDVTLVPCIAHFS